MKIIQETNDFILLKQEENLQEEIELIYTADIFSFRPVEVDVIENETVEISGYSLLRGIEKDSYTAKDIKEAIDKLTSIHSTIKEIETAIQKDKEMCGE